MTQEGICADNYFIDYRNKNKNIESLEYAKKVCDFRLGKTIYKSTEDCDENHNCKKNILIDSPSYKGDILITPDYKMILIEPLSSKQNTNYKNIINKDSFPKMDASSLAKCINVIANKLNKAVTKEIPEKTENKNSFNELSLEKLEFAKANITYPKYLEDMGSVFIKFSLTPSMRFTNSYDLDLKHSSTVNINKGLSYKEINTTKGIKSHSVHTIYRDSKINQIKNHFSNISVSLRGDEYNIIKLSARERSVTPLEQLNWTWQIKPKSKEAKNLFIVIEAVPLNKNVSTYSKQISLQIDSKYSFFYNFIYYFNKYWQFLLGSILIPLLVYGWKKKTIKS